MKSAHASVHRSRTKVSSASIRFLCRTMGALLVLSSTRFWLKGWLEELNNKPQHYIPFYRLDFGGPPSETLVYSVYFTLILCGLAMFFSLASRAAAGLACVLLFWVQTWDATNYLNHYALLVILLGMLAMAPCHGRRDQNDTIDLRWVNIFRAQLACVYIFAAFAKLGSDWLRYGQPLDLWLRAHWDMPILGPFFSWSWGPLIMSWAGFIYDATIVFFLCKSKTRPFAYIAVIVFHVMTSLLFNIGMFPWIMILATTVFFPPDWPEHLKFRSAVKSRFHFQKASAITLGKQYLLAYCFFFLQITTASRHYFLPGNVLWNDDGMRLSWRVMVREKSGSLTYIVHDQDSGRISNVNPHEYLEWRQVAEMSARPAMIVLFAKKLEAILQNGDGTRRFQIFADSHASLNGRRRSRMVNPHIDLLAVNLSKSFEGEEYSAYKVSIAEQHVVPIAATENLLLPMSKDAPLHRIDIVKSLGLRQ